MLITALELYNYLLQKERGMSKANIAYLSVETQWQGYTLVGVLLLL